MHLASCIQPNGKLGSIIYTLRTPKLCLVYSEIKWQSIFSGSPFAKLCSCTSLGASACTALPFFGPSAHALLTATCKQPCVYQFPVVILGLCAPMSAYDYWFYKERPFNGVKAFRFAFKFSLRWCSSKAMKPLTCPGMSGRQGESFDKAVVIHFNFLIKPKYLLWIGPLKYTN